VACYGRPVSWKKNWLSTNENVPPLNFHIFTVQPVVEAADITANWGAVASTAVATGA